MEPKETEKELLRWTTTSRPFKRRTRQFYVTMFSVAGILIAILVIMNEFLPILLVISLVFLYYVMSTVPPSAIECVITNKGIKIAGVAYDWELLGRFWFVKRMETEILAVEAATFAGRIEVVVPADLKDKVRMTLSAHLSYEAVPPTLVDKTSSWVSNKLSTK